MKRKLLFAIVALLCSVGTWAQSTIDITSKRLTSANLSTLTGWTFDDSFNATGNDYTDYKTDGDANVVEFYSEWAADPGNMAVDKNFKMTQTVTLSAGTYKLSAYGFYREKNGDGTNTKAYLKAGSSQTYLHGLTSSGVSGYTGSNDLYKSANAFSQGFFKNTLEFTLDTKQNIEIGIVGTFNTQVSWCVAGPMTLEKYLTDGTEITEFIVNPSFESGDKTGWTDDTASDGSGDGSDDKIDVLNTDALSGKDGSYFAERWWYNSNMNIHQTTPTIPEGFYRITAYAKAEAGDIVIYGKAGSNDEKTQAVTTLQDYDVEVFQETAGAIKLGLKGHHVTQTHVAFDNFRLTFLGNPYPALEEAIDDAESKTLGFEVGEYAPYNNVAALTVLSSAKAINEAKTATYAEVVAAINTLTSATWTVNTELMDAIYDGQFANATVLDNTLAEKGATVPGWNHSVDIANIRQISTQSKFVGGRAMYFWQGTVSYGQTLGYTMPLKANSVYKFSFQYAGWNTTGTNAPSVSILNENNEGKTLAALPSGASTPASGPTRYTIYFATDDTPGSYTFKYKSPDDTNSTIGDLSLIRVDVLPIEANYVNGTYPSVTLDRTFSAEKWNTLCVPFAFDKSSFAEVRELSGISVNGEHITLELTEAETIVAGKPYLVKANNNGDGLTAKNVALPGVDVQDSNASADVYTVNYVGTYGGTTLNAETAGGNAFVISDNAIWNVDSDVTVGAYRAYFTVTSVSPVKALSFDFGDATGINTIANGQQPMANGPIYNLAGQRMSKVKRGVNIMNGKKVIVK